MAEAPRPVKILQLPSRIYVSLLLCKLCHQTHALSERGNMKQHHKIRQIRFNNSFLIKSAIPATKVAELNWVLRHGTHFTLILRLKKKLWLNFYFMLVNFWLKTKSLLQIYSRKQWTQFFQNVFPEL